MEGNTDGLTVWMGQKIKHVLHYSKRRMIYMQHLSTDYTNEIRI